MSIVTNLKCTLAVTAGLCSSFAYAQKHPHVILIMTDQQRGDALGCMVMKLSSLPIWTGWPAREHCL